MVPPESFSTDAPHSSRAFCSGCDGGTQCDSLSSNVLSCASAPVAPPINKATAQTHPAKRSFMGSSLEGGVGLVANFCDIQPNVRLVVKRIVWYQTKCRNGQRAGRALR